LMCSSLLQEPLNVGRLNVERSTCTRRHEEIAVAAIESKIAPALFVGKPASDVVRVWVSGCAGGEIVYAVAGVLYAYAERFKHPSSIQIFATDRDTNAIWIARQGRYPKTLASTVLPSYLMRFFREEQQHYCVTPALRNLITFAEHDLVRDPPFSRMDLIVCTNFPAALSPDEHEYVLRMFHWSLRPLGYLVLNPEAEGVYWSELFMPHADVPGILQRKSIPGIIPHMSRQASSLRPQPAGDSPQADEQLQAANGHLQAMNQVLRRKVGELVQANNDLNNVMRATHLATILLDRELQITRFTPQAPDLFNIIPADQGRPLAHITHRLDYDRLLGDAANVLASLQSVEREVRSEDGRWFLVRVSPYRTADERIDGVVLVCVDITARLTAESEVRHAYAEMEQRVLDRTQELTTANLQLQAEIAERSRLEQERVALLHKLVTMQEDERRRIARELHDQMGQSVAALSMGLEMLAASALDPERRRQGIARLRQITAHLDEDINRLALDLRPTALDDLGLVDAAQQHVERWAEQAGIHADFQAVTLDSGRLPREVESVIYRVIQEALTNVLKHAAAQNVGVILERQRDQLRVIVEDDGRGFDLDALQQARDTQQRLGLLGMQERVALVGGTATFETAPSAGTTLFIQIPLPSDAPGDRAAS
jgi:PAS domain S-box-containing protein